MKKISKEQYKKYPFPIHIFLGFILTSVIGVILIDIIAMKMLAGSEDNPITLFFGFLLLFIVFAVYVVICYFIIELLCNYKAYDIIYKGRFLYNFMIFISLGCVAAFLIIKKIMKSSNIDHSFFRSCTLFLECIIPIIFMILVMYFSERCNACGLIHSYRCTNSTKENLGTKTKYHTEGGYYTDVKTRGTIDNNVSVDITTSQYVPKTTVFDGVYQTTRSTYTHCCSVCGNIKTNIYTTEKKI